MNKDLDATGDEEGRKRPRPTKRTPVEIPASAREIKARFWKEPPRALALEIAKFASETGKWFLHPDCTYIKLMPGTDVRFLEMFGLHPRFRHDEDAWSPCASCPHDMPKFKTEGIVAWVPELGIIVVIGDDCFKRLNPEGYQKALHRYEEDVRQRTDERYLLRRLHLVPVLISDVEHDLITVRAFDKMREEALDAFDEHRIDLLDHAKNGKLKVEERRRQITHGVPGGRLVVTRNIYATIKGEKFLDRAIGRFAPRFLRIIAQLRKVEMEPPHEPKVLAMTDAERRAAALDMQAALKEIDEARKAFEALRRFISQETGKTVQTWSQLPGATLPFYFDYDATEMRIGMSPLKSTVVKIPTECQERFEPLPDMPPIDRH